MNEKSTNGWWFLLAYCGTGLAFLAVFILALGHADIAYGRKWTFLISAAVWGATGVAATLVWCAVNALLVGLGARGPSRLVAIVSGALCVLLLLAVMRISADEVLFVFCLVGVPLALASVTAALRSPLSDGRDG